MRKETCWKKQMKKQYSPDAPKGYVLVKQRTVYFFKKQEKNPKYLEKKTPGIPSGYISDFISPKSDVKHVPPVYKYIRMDVAQKLLKKRVEQYGEEYETAKKNAKRAKRRP